MVNFKPFMNISTVSMYICSQGIFFRHHGYWILTIKWHQFQIPHFKGTCNYLHRKIPTIIHICGGLLLFKRLIINTDFNTTKQHAIAPQCAFTCKNLRYSSLWTPPSAMCCLSASSSPCANDAKSTAVKYSPCKRAFKQCCAQRDPSC